MNYIVIKPLFKISGQLKQIDLNNIEKFDKANDYPELSLCIGYAYFSPAVSKTLDDIIDIADKMMYEEKQKFKNKKEISIDSDKTFCIIT